MRQVVIIISGYHIKSGTKHKHLLVRTIILNEIPKDNKRVVVDLQLMYVVAFNCVFDLLIKQVKRINKIMNSS